MTADELEITRLASELSRARTDLSSWAMHSTLRSSLDHSLAGLDGFRRLNHDYSLHRIAPAASELGTIVPSE